MNVPHDRPRLILASKSPRRKYLLEQAGLTFSIIPSDVDESSVTMSEPDAYVSMLAEAKAFDISEQHPDSWVIGADTIVLFQCGSSLDAQTAERQNPSGAHGLLYIL